MTREEIRADMRHQLMIICLPRVSEDTLTRAGTRLRELEALERILDEKEKSVDYVMRDGKIAVLVSRGFGAGWYSWNTEVPECLYHPEIVALVESFPKDYKRGYNTEMEKVIGPVATRLFGDDFYTGGGDGLSVVWVEPGQRFRIDEYDGSESLVLLDPDDYLVAPGKA